MSQLRIVVTGLIGSIPLAGLSLHYLQYVWGLRKLGHDVLYLEDTGSWYYEPSSNLMTQDSSTAKAHLSHVMDGLGLSTPWVLIDLDGSRVGSGAGALESFLSTADAFLNVTGAGLVRDRYLRVPLRAYIDTDPGYVQLRVAMGSDADEAHLGRHTHYFSFGHNIGLKGCAVPSLGLKWLPTRQPIDLDYWSTERSPEADAPFTTILKWQTYDPIEHKGVVYGMKDEEFIKFVELPMNAGIRLEIAATGTPPVEGISSLGWRYRNAGPISSTLDSYRDYIWRSKGEWSVAKSGYVKLWTGWFGDRSASYLAASRPVALQSTGYEEWLPTGEGLMPFDSVDEAKLVLTEVSSNYSRHASKARELAAEYFRSELVLTDLLERVNERP